MVSEGFSRFINGSLYSQLAKVAKDCTPVVVDDWPIDDKLQQ